MDFGQALAEIKNGRLVARTAWASDGTFIYLVPGSRFTVNRAPLLGIYPAGYEIEYQPHIDMGTETGVCGTWVASQEDLLAEDWRTLSWAAPNTV
jgi:hypothetical protein